MKIGLILGNSIFWKLKIICYLNHLNY